MSNANYSGKKVSPSVESPNRQFHVPTSLADLNFIRYKYIARTYAYYLSTIAWLNLGPLNGLSTVSTKVCTTTVYCNVIVVLGILSAIYYISTPKPVFQLVADYLPKHTHPFVYMSISLPSQVFFSFFLFTENVTEKMFFFVKRETRT